MNLRIIIIELRITLISQGSCEHIKIIYLFPGVCKRYELLQLYEYMIQRYRGRNNPLWDILGEDDHIGVSSEAVSWVMYVNYLLL